MSHPAIDACLASLTPAELAEWNGRDVYAESTKAPPLSPGLFEKFEQLCTELLGYRPVRIA